jgi:hypothetical protein
MQITDLNSTAQSVARFQSLQAGQYWKALRAVLEQDIAVGSVLLIESIRWVDNAPHTIILRPHPSKIGQRVRLEIPQEDGTTNTVYFWNKEHRFLLNDFLNTFEFEPDHESVRAHELAQAQQRIVALQSELVEFQKSPALLAQVVEDGLRKQAEEAAKEGGEQPATAGAQLVPVAGTDERIAIMTTGTVANAIGSGITEEGIAAMKAQASREHQIATIQANWIQAKTSEIATAITAMTPYFQEQAAAALAHTEDVRTYVDKLMKGIESLDLYVGKDVEVLTVREGVSAAKGEPLTFMQRKLLMDEELGVWTDVDEWCDFNQRERFFDALRQHDGLVQQIFPTERCVLVMATTRRNLNYGDGLINAMVNQKNHAVFMLVRNGMNIHCVHSPVESHLGAARLFPTKDDQQAIFRGLNGSQIKFEDVAYTDKLQDHERFAMHYKRFLLLACGLDHRLKLFGDFYEGPQSMDFVSMEFQEKYCRFLHDDDASTMLPGLARPHVMEWVNQKNEYLRSGSRVLCNWRELMNPDTAPSACKSGGREHLYVERPYTPSEVFGHAVVSKSGLSLCVDVTVSGYSFTTHGDRTFSCKVNISKFKRYAWGDTDLAYLCLDAVEPEELHWYIHNREARVKHLHYLRFFKQALRFIERERAQEHGTRQRMLQALQEGGVGEPADRVAVVGKAVMAWRAANRGKELPTFEEAGKSPVWKALLDQMYTLAGAAQSVDHAAAVQSLMEGQGLAPLRLVLSGAGKFTIYAAPSARERDDRLVPHVWVHRIALAQGKNGFVEKSRSWKLLPEASAAETTLHEWEAAKEWLGLESPFASFAKKQEVLAHATGFADRLQRFSGPMSVELFRQEMALWEAANEDCRRSFPSLAIPFGVVYYPRYKTLNYLCVGVSNAHVVLGRLAPTSGDCEQMRDTYLSNVREVNKGAARRAFNDGVGSPIEWTLMGAPVSQMTAVLREMYGDYAAAELGVDVGSLRKQGMSPLLAQGYENWSADLEDGAHVWLADGALNDQGRLTIDAILGISLPEDYEELRMREFTAKPYPGVTLKFSHWLDLGPFREESYHDTGNDEHRMLALSVLGEDAGSSATSHLFTSRAVARAWALAHDVSPKRVVPAAEIPDAPQPPEGYERWYIVD